MSQRAAAVHALHLDGNRCWLAKLPASTRALDRIALVQLQRIRIAPPFDMCSYASSVHKYITMLFLKTLITRFIKKPNAKYELNFYFSYLAI
jgi:hypothetical protein